MEYVNIGSLKDKKEELRVKIQKLQMEIDELKRNGDKYKQLPQKENYMTYLKEQWNNVAQTIGKEQHNTMMESHRNLMEEKSKKGDIEWQNVEVNEKWAIQNHYNQMAILKKEIEKLDKRIKDVQTKSMESIKLQDKKSKLEEEYNELKRYSESDIIMFAKQRKAAYLNAKKRYSKLKPLEKVKIKLSGKKLDWEKIKDDHSITTTDLELMYQGRSR